jgi:exopolysaccharide production protein ExoZ
MSSDQATVATDVKYIGIQYARAAAALVVVIYHACERAGLGFEQGSRGVDLFFVISGFIMWSVTGRTAQRPFKFLLNRVKRIVPLYWIATGIVILAAYLNVVSDDIAPASILRSLLFIPYIAEGSDHIWPILSVGWTLNYEMFFYVVFAAFLFAPRAVRFWGLTITLAGLVIAGALAPKADAIWSTYTSGRMIQFLAGVWIAETVRRDIIVPPALSLPLIFLGVLGLYLIPFNGNHLIPVACAAAAGGVIAGVVSIDVRRRVPDYGSLRILGDASYSIYLFHGLALAVATMTAASIGLPAWMTVIPGTAAGVVAGLAAYKLVEQPIGKLVSSRR